MLVGSLVRIGGPFMTSVSSSTAALLQYFRDREARSDAPGTNTNGAKALPADTAGAGLKLASVQTSNVGSAASTELDVSQVQDRLGSLIDAQVSSGKLTDSQGDVLKRVLNQGSTASDDSSAVATTPETVPQPKGPTKAEPSTADLSSQGAGGVQDSGAVLAAFIKNLQSTQVSRSGYGSTGSTGSATIVGTRVLDVNT